MDKIKHKGFEVALARFFLKKIWFLNVDMESSEPITIVLQ